MDFYQSVINKIGKWFILFEAYFKENPMNISLIIAIVFIPLGLGSILGKKWVVDPANGTQKFWYSIVGHRVFGLDMGIAWLTAGILSLILFIISRFI